MEDGKEVSTDREKSIRIGVFAVGVAIHILDGFYVGMTSAIEKTGKEVVELATSLGEEDWQEDQVRVKVAAVLVVFAFWLFLLEFLFFLAALRFYIG